MKYLITVSTVTRHGRTNLHTFGKLLEAQHLRWFLETPPSRKQVKERLTPHSPFGVQSWPPPPRRQVVGHDLYDELRDGPFHLFAGVDPSSATLAVVLNALRSGQRHEVDLGDIKLVLSQLGSDITRLNTLSGEQRQHAEAALYPKILQRCTTL
jgi:hypothetical protein